MPSWNELLDEIQGIDNQAKGDCWIKETQKSWLQKISKQRDGRNVMFYASGFLQKPQVSSILLQISPDDINGFMSVMYGMDWSKGLTLLLHTPGGITNATETIVEYLHQKFDDIEVIIPTYAMSAGTMISLAANRIFMGRQSQLGPIDPQMQIGGRSMSARAIVNQFETAKEEILTDTRDAAVWAPILHTLGPALLTEAQDALDYGESMVARWLERRQFIGQSDAKKKARDVSNYFNRSDKHKSHGRRIDRDEARSQNLDVIDIELDQDFQDAILTSYHVGTIVFEKSLAAKFITSNHGRNWVKNA